LLERVRDFYDRNTESEWARLQSGLGRVEYAVTLRLIRNHFPPSGPLCDIGAGPGRYSLEMARWGYAVTVFDLSSASIDRARAEFGRAQLSAEAFLVGSATDLSSLPADAFDAALLLGPIYHLSSSGERLQALSELRRILRPGGVAVVGYLNSWGLIRTGLSDFPRRYATAEGARSILRPQVFENVTSGFTDCYWSTPPEALTEIRSAGLDLITYAGAEGFAGGMHAIVDALGTDEPGVLETIVQIAPETSESPQYRDATDHLHIVVRRGR
jgi:SAM-dependent methyltransferase